MKGTRIEQYEFERLLGEGAFGQVWLARDHRLNRKVAIKRLKAEVVGDPEVRRYFEREAETLIQVSEPHVVHVLDRIEVDGLPALVTEFMEGGSLADLRKTREDPFAVDDVARWCEQAALGLAAMHKRGFLHRDIKPANLFLSRDGNLSIGDFGLARSAEATQTLGMQGTMPYMSPEQIRGAEIDARSDLFALGVAIYELLTGERPFGNGLDRHERPPTVRSKRSGVPAYLSGTIDSLLETDVEKRIQTADELLLRLRGQRPGRSVSLPSRRQILALVPVLLAVVLGVAGGRCWIPGLPWCGSGACEMEAPADRRVAILPFEYRGDPAHARVAEEIPRLVAARLDGVGGISAPAPAAFAACPVDAALFATNDPDVSSWMEDQHARLAVHGVVSELQGQFRIDLTFHYRREDEFFSEKETITLQQVSDALPIVNDVGLRVLRHLLVEYRDDLAREALLNSESLDAMCAFLQGVEDLRLRRLNPRNLDQAISLDSTMAMAYYLRAEAASWGTEGPTVGRENIVRAQHFATNTGPYGQGLIRAATAGIQGNIDEKEAVLFDLVTRYSRSPWAWLRIADLHYQHNASRGRPWWESRREFEHVIDLDAGNQQTYLFNSFVKVAQGDDDYVRALSRGGWVRGGSAIEAFTIGSQSLRDSVMAAEGSWCGEGFAMHNVYILIYPDNHHNILQFLENHICDPESKGDERPADEAWLALTLAHVNAGMGRWETAQQWFDAVPASFRPWRLVYEGLAWSLPFIPASEDELRDMIDRLERWKPQGEPSIVDPEQFGMLEERFNPHIRVHEHLRQYCLAALHARLGDTAEARRRLEVLDQLIALNDVKNFVTDLVHIGQARIAFHDGDMDTALAQLDQVQRRRYFDGGYSSFFQRADSRYLRAECLAAKGRYEESLGWYDSADQNMEMLLIYTGMAHLGQAKALEKLGRDAEALERYRKFLMLYDDADPYYEDDIAFAAGRVSALEAAR